MILKVWNLLCEAYYDKNSYGGDVAEIYFYLLQSRSPAKEAHVNKHGLTTLYSNGVMGKEWLEEDTATAQTFKDLFLLFEKQWDCKLTFEDGTPVSEWKPEPFHRLHIKVTRSR
jgi:hypothetical protein